MHAYGNALLKCSVYWSFKSSTTRLLHLSPIPQIGKQTAYICGRRCLMLRICLLSQPTRLSISITVVLKVALLWPPVLRMIIEDHVLAVWWTFIALCRPTNHYNIGRKEILGHSFRRQGTFLARPVDGNAANAFDDIKNVGARRLRRRR